MNLRVHLTITRAHGDCKLPVLPHRSSSPSEQCGSVPQVVGVAGGTEPHGSYDPPQPRHPTAQAGNVKVLEAVCVCGLVFISHYM